MREHQGPTEEEIAGMERRAEEMMSPDQKAASERREGVKFQERDPFEDFMEHIDANDSRRPPTPEERRELDARLARLGDVLGGSGVRWHLDGAINISLLKGDYIGIHKDVDVSVESDDLEALDAALEKKGYGMFLSYPKNAGEPRGKKVLERVGAKKFREASSEHVIISAIDEEGRIREDDGGLTNIDTHIVRRNEKGEALGAAGVALPEKWSEPRVVDFQGRELRLSHPAKVAYYKLHESRSYDRTDLRKLAETGEMTVDDMKEIEERVETELAARRSQGEELLKGIVKKLGPGTTEAQAYDAFMSDPAIAARIRPGQEAVVREVAKAIAESPDRSLKAVAAIAFEKFGADRAADEQRKRVGEMRAWVEDSERIAGEKRRLADLE